jgi:ABC-type glycerol-3-phosphate transport system permease component
MADAVTRRRRNASLLLAIPAALQLFPLFYLLCLSFKTGGEAMEYPPKILPRAITFVNYVQALNIAPLGRFLFNSLVVAASITILQTATAILAAYALARIEFRGKALVFGFFVATMLVPGEVTIIPNYFALAKIGWIDAYAGLIIPFASSGFGVFLLYQFFRTIPKELEEAATLDGASRLRFLFQIMVPMSAPAIAAFAVYSFIGAWNQYLWPLVITQSTNMQTAQVGLGMFRAQNESLSWGVIMAATAMLMAPTVILFTAAQRHFVRGLTMGGVKG